MLGEQGRLGEQRSPSRDDLIVPRALWGLCFSSPLESEETTLEFYLRFFPCDQVLLLLGSSYLFPISPLEHGRKLTGRA